MNANINLLLFSFRLILYSPEFILETHPFPGAVAQPSLWSLPRLPSSRFIGRNVTTAASTAVGETRDPDATAPRGAYPWPWISDKNEGMPGKLTVWGGWNGQVKEYKDIHPFLSFSCQTLKSVPLIFFIRCQVEKDSWEVRVSLEGLDGRYGRFWLVSNSLWIIESQPLRTEGNDHITYVITRDNESLGSPSIATRLIKTGNYGRIMDWPEWHNVLPGFFGSVAMVHQFRYYFRVPWIMRLLSYVLGQVSEPATSLWTFFSRGTWEAQQKL